MKNKYLYIVLLWLALVGLAGVGNQAYAKDVFFISYSHVKTTYDKCKGKMYIKLLVGDDDYYNDFTRGMSLWFQDTDGKWKELAYSGGGDYGGGAADGTSINVDGDKVHFKMYNNDAGRSGFNGNVDVTATDDGGSEYWATGTWDVPDRLIGKNILFKITGTWHTAGFDDKYIDDIIQPGVTIEKVPMPTNVSVKNNCNNVTISWNNPSLGCEVKSGANDQYRAYWVEIYRDGSLIASLKNNEASYNDNGRAYGSSPNYKLRAAVINGAGTTVYSDYTFEMSPQIPSLLSAVGDLETDQNECGKVLLTWSYPAAGSPKGYIIERKGPNDTQFQRIGEKTSAFALSFTDANVENGKKYEYKVASTDGCQTSYSASPVSITTVQDATSPTSVDAVVSTDKKYVTVTWVSSMTVAPSKFVIKRDGQAIAEVKGTAAYVYKDDNISKCTKYKYSVEAVTACNTSIATTKEVIVPADGLSEITLQASDGKFPNRVELKWNKVANAGTYYIIRDNQLINTINNPGATSYLDYDAVPGDYYTYFIQATSKCELNTDTVRSNDMGFILPNGKITGLVKTLSGNFVEDVEVSVSPLLGSSVIFNSIESYINVVPNLIPTDKPFAVEFWVKKKDANGTGLIVWQGEKSGTGNAVTVAYENATTLSFDLFNEKLSATAPADVSWHHWLVQFDPTSKLQQMYMDGKLIKERIAGTTYKGTGMLSIGRNPVTPATPPNKGSMNVVLGSDMGSALSLAETSTVQSNDVAWNNEYSFNPSKIQINQTVDLKDKSFSVSFWAKPSELYADASLVLWQGQTITRSGLHIGFRNNTTFTFDFFNDGLDVNVGYLGNVYAWHNYTCVYDATTKKQYIYIDGQLAGSRTTAGNYIGSGSLILGDGMPWGKAYDGMLDDFQLWTKALTKQDIQTNLYRQLVGNETGLMFSFDFDNVTPSSSSATFAGKPNTYSATISNSSSFVFAVATTTGNGYSNYLASNSMIDLANKSFTIEFLAKRSAYSASVFMQLGNLEVSQESHKGQQLYLGFDNAYNGTLRMGFYYDNLDVPATTVNQWEHWACVYNATNKEQSIYRNGTLVGSRITSGMIAPEALLFLDKKSLWSPGNNNNIQIDEFRVWSVARTQTDISQNMNSKITTGTNLVAYWSEPAQNTFTQYGTYPAVTGNSSAGTIMTNAPQINGKSFTIQFWAKRRVTTGSQIVISQGTSTGNKLNVGFTKPNEFYFDFYGTGGIAAPIAETTDWQHFSVVYDNVAKLQKVYVNGALQKSGAMTTALQSTGDWTFGKNTVSTYGVFDGQLDEFRVWDRALTDADITNNYKLVKDFATTNLVAWFDFEGNSLTDKMTTDGTTSSFSQCLVAANGSPVEGIFTPTQQSLVGQYDEFKVWARNFTADEIIRNYNRTSGGNETDMVLYYRFDEPSETISFDLTTEDLTDNHGTLYKCLRSAEQPTELRTSAYTDGNGNYSIDKINYGGLKGQEFVVRPIKLGHDFDPETRLRTLDPNNSIVDAVDFVDLSTFPVSGTIMYEGTQCYETSKEVLVDGNSAAPAAYTNKDGFYDMSVELQNHTFSVKRDVIKEGYKSSAIKFDGSTSVASKAAVISEDGDFVVEFSTRRNNNQSTRGTVLDIGDFGVLYHTDNNMYFGKISETGIQQYVKVPISGSDTSWMAWTVEYDATRQSMDVYQNGILTVNALGIDLTATGELYVGTIKDAPMNAPENQSAAWYNLAAAKMNVPNVDLTNKPFSIEFWAKPYTMDNSTRLLVWQGASETRKGLNIGYKGYNKFTFAFFGDDLDVTLPFADANAAKSWHHFALVFDTVGINTKRIYMDGQLLGSKSDASAKDNFTYQGTGMMYIGGKVNDWSTNFAYDGALDEFRIWNKALAFEEIEHNMLSSLNSESALLLNYTFDGINNGKAITIPSSVNNAQYAATLADFQWTPSYLPNMNKWLTNASVDEIRIWTEKLGAVRIEDYAKRTLSGQENGLASYFSFDEGGGTVSDNKVTSQNTNDVDISNNTNWVRGTMYSDELVYEYQPINQKYMPINGVYKMFVDGPKTSLDFNNVSRFNLAVNILGNCDYEIGLSDVVITSTPACFDTTIQNIGKKLNIMLPPLTFNIQVLPKDKTKKIEPQVVSMRSGDTVLTFRYRSPMQIEANPSVSSLNRLDKACTQTVVFDQFVKDTVTFEVFEDYNGQRCPVEGSNVFIQDDISSKSDPVTISLPKGSGGASRYIAYPSWPTFANTGDYPYRKKMDLVAVDSLGRTAGATIWGIIRGDLPLPADFTSVMPEVFAVLHDPPGDGSYSYMEKGTSFSSTIGNFEVKDGSFSIGGTVSILPKATVAEVEQEPIAHAGLNFNIATSQSKNTEKTFSISTNQAIQTSDDEQVVGADMDVFIGAALNWVFSPTRRLYTEGCQVKEQKALSARIDTISTTFIYTAKHIREELIPRLEEIKADTLSRITDEKQKQKVKVSMDAQIANWQSILDQNDKVLDKATFKRNISFSFGAIFETSETIDTIAVESKEKSLGVTVEEAYSFGYYANGAGGQVDIGLGATSTTGSTEASEKATSVTTGYVLMDNDVGDYFSVSVYQDPVYRTPAFKAVGGQSMCPWENGTQAREGVALTVESSIDGTAVVSDVPEDSKAIFRVGITNMSMTGEGVEMAIGLNNASNPDGAVIKLNGVVLGTDPVIFEPEADQTLYATLTVERGPLAYEYPDIQLELYSLCEKQSQADFSSNPDFPFQKLYDSKNLTVNFKRPCVTGLEVMEPEAQWIFNQINRQRDADTMHVFFTAENLIEAVESATDAEANNNELSLFRFEYAPVNSNTPYMVAGGELGVNDVTLLGSGASRYVHLPAYLGSLDDGLYKVRIAAVCKDQRKSVSPWVEGSMFRTPPVMLGTPQPMDGILEANDNIEIEFDKEIWGEAIRPHNVRLFSVLAGTQYKPSSLKFDGLNDYSVLSNDSNDVVNYSFGKTDDFTIEFWMKTPTAGWNGTPVIVSNKDFGSPINKGFAFYGLSDGKSLAFNIADGVNKVELNAGVVADGQWHHVAVACDRDGDARLFVDLVQKDIKSIASVGDVTTSLALALGQDGTLNYNNYLRGNIDEVRIWRAALNNGQLLNKWRAPLIGNEPNLVGNWRLDPRPGNESSFFDISGFYPEAQIVEGTWDKYDAAPIVGTEWVDNVPVTVGAFANRIVLTPNIERKWIEDTYLTAQVTGIKDHYGNKSARYEWSFYVDRNAVMWEVRDREVIKLADSSLTFGVKLINNGALAEQFWIEDLPEWLTCNVSRGTLTTYSDQTIQFTVNPSLNNGDYTATVKARTVNGWEPLNIKLRVVCPQPKEQVNVAKFQYSMNLIGKLNIAGTISNDNLDVVRAYVGNELRGVGSVTYVPQTKDYRLMMNLYSNTTNAETFVFRIWDASACMDFVGTSQSISFADNSVLGSQGNPFEISTQGRIEKSYSLLQGWNWLAFNLNPAQNSVADFNLAGYLQGSFTNNDQISDRTNSALYLNASWSGTLTKLRNTSGYMIFANKALTAKASGYLIPASTPITLKKGWNFIGYPGNQYVKISDALASILFAARDGDIIKSQDKFATFVAGQGWVGDLQYFAPNEAYLLYISNDAIIQKSAELILNTEAPTMSKQEVTNTDDYRKQYLENVAKTLGWTTDMHQYQYSTSIVGAIAINGQLISGEGCVVGLFANGVCRGISLPVTTSDGLRFYTSALSNSTNEQLSVRIFVPGLGVVDAAQPFNFVADKLYGSTSVPHLFEINNNTTDVSDVPLALPTNFILSQPRPNPMHDQAMVVYQVPYEAKVRVEVYNVLGARVAVVAQGLHHAGVYNINWKALDDNGQRLDAGVYSLRLISNNTVITRSLVIVE